MPRFKLAVRSPIVAVLLMLPLACGDSATRVNGPPMDVAFAPHVTHGVDRPVGTSSILSAVAPNTAPAMVLGAVSSADKANAPPLSPAPVGHLDGPDHLAHLFQRLADLDDGRTHDDVRILQYGDSHTASDMGTAAFRRHMQLRFGDGGRGFVSIGVPWKSYVQEGVRGYMTDEFEPERMRLKDPQSGGDGCFGLLGVGIAAQAPGARAWTQIAPHFSRVEFDYWQAPRGGSFDVFIDGAHAGRVATRSAQAGSGFFGFDVVDASHQVEVRTVGDGDVRVFGMTLDRAQAGVVVDALGINGAQIFTALRWNEDHFAEQIRHQAPDLVVLAYGTNESLASNLEDAAYERGLVDLLGRVSRAAPGAACMLLGPPDLARWTKGTRGYHAWPRVLEIETIQRRVASAAGCGFYSQIDAMGGPGSIAAWAEEPEPRAQGDRTHLTRSGYTQVGTALATDVLRAYDDWRAEMGLPPSGGEKAWNVARR
jgi:lysophospholipase L1-like esterase